MLTQDHFWKAFAATGSPQVYLLYKNRNQNNANDDEREKRNASL